MLDHQNCDNISVDEWGGSIQEVRYKNIRKYEERFELKNAV
jgi:hypothetical protein